MRRRLSVSIAVLAFLTLVSADRAQAQFAGIGSGDPFALYYGYYLPHQAAIAAQPTPLDTINQMTANRAYTAQTDRAALYDPISPYGEDESDPLRPGSGRQGGRPRSTPLGFSYGNDNSNARGTGPAMYYNRTARYFPTLRVGRGRNANIATLRGNRGGGGGMSMPSAPAGAR